MIVYVSNNSGWKARELAATYPGKVGHLYSPDGMIGPFQEFPYALDNGCFKRWDKTAFFRMLDRVSTCDIKPLWVAVPDVVYKAGATVAKWHYWRDRVASYGIPLAFVAQDGHTPESVPSGAQVVFIGGSTEWKREAAPIFCRYFDRVHIGRVNTKKWLDYFADAGAESVDGTGYFRGDKKQLQGLEDFLRERQCLSHSVL